MSVKIDAEHEVHVEPCPLCHSAPHDRQRDRGERDLEEIRRRSRDGCEPREGRLPDREQLVDRREEPGAADEAVASVAERKPEPDEEVDDRREREDQGVLRSDVADVLHPCQPCLEEREAGLHEDHEDRCDDHPDRAGRDGEFLGAHSLSTSSSACPVLLCVTLGHADIQQMPSPLTCPVRAASTIACEHVGRDLVADDEGHQAFGRKRDSNTRPRYSCVIPRSRP